MNVTFHALTSFGISHLAARSFDGNATRAFDRSDLRILIPAFVAGVLSHGILDGLKHGYPIPSVVDPPIALLLGAAWCAAVKTRYRVLFAMVFVGVMLPDVLDLGPGIVNWLFGWHLPTFRPHLFPWHWPDGSGSLYLLHGAPPRPGHGALDAGDNQMVSITNHLIVLIFAGVAITLNRDPFLRRLTRR